MENIKKVSTKSRKRCRGWTRSIVVIAEFFKKRTTWKIKSQRE